LTFAPTVVFSLSCQELCGLKISVTMTDFGFQTRFIKQHQRHWEGEFSLFIDLESDVQLTNLPEKDGCRFAPRQKL
jgi:hypothetical protein